MQDGQTALTALRAEPATALLVLDYDGTLAPIVERPDEAWPAPGAVAALRACAAVFGDVVIVTGRPALGPVTLAGLDGVPGLTVLGHYGAERWTAATGVTGPPEHPGIAVARVRLPETLGTAPPGVWIEDKGLSLAVHTRPAADPDAALDLVTPAVAEVAAETGLAVEHGRMLIELRSPDGADKGGALRALVAERRPSAVLVAGDDHVDLPAVEVRAELRAAGTPGVAVFVDNPEAPPVLRERADVVVPGVVGMVRFLEELADG